MISGDYLRILKYTWGKRGTILHALETDESPRPICSRGNGAVCYRPAMKDRVESVCDLLMAAAYADEKLHDSERKTVESYLIELLPDGELTDALKARMEQFDPKTFKLKPVCEQFSSDSAEDRQKLVDLIAGVHASDKEYDFAEDDFLIEVVEALGLSESDAMKHALDYEVEVLQESLATLRSTPPPVPGAR